MPFRAVSSGVETINMSVEVNFRFAGVDLGTQSYGAVYERSANETKFTIKRAEFPSAPDRQYRRRILRLADIVGGPSTEQMLVYSVAGLKKIAAGNNAEVKAGLKTMLEKCENTAEKRTLLDLLGAP